MSATGRGAVRHEHDDYSTPPRDVRAILKHLTVTGERCLEPCAGSGVIVRELAALAANVKAVDICEHHRIELDNSGASEVVIGDYLSMDALKFYDLVITNPPFALALDVVQKALSDVHPGGTVAMLLRLNWLASQDRIAFHKAHPSDVYVLPVRPSFTECLRWKIERCPLFVKPKTVVDPNKKPKRCQMEAGHAGECITIGTDACEYGWFVWSQGRGNRWFLLDQEAAQ